MAKKVKLLIEISEEEYFWILKSDKTVFADAASKEAMLYAIKTGKVLSDTPQKDMEESEEERE